MMHEHICNTGELLASAAFKQHTPTIWSWCTPEGSPGLHSCIMTRKGLAHWSTMSPLKCQVTCCQDHTIPQIRDRMCTIINTCFKRFWISHIPVHIFTPYFIIIYYTFYDIAHDFYAAPFPFLHPGSTTAALINIWHGLVSSHSNHVPHGAGMDSSNSNWQQVCLVPLFNMGFRKRN